MNVRLNIGEMSELAEGARLEIACTAKSGTEGSNPSLSAIQLIISMTYKVKLLSAAIRHTILKMIDGN